MSDEDPPLGTREVPQHIIDGLVEDSRVLRKAAERIEQIMSTPESVNDARVNYREMHDLCETCLAAVINLFDLNYPSRPRVDLSLGYEFHSGPVGFITGGSNSPRFSYEIDEMRELTVIISTTIGRFLEGYRSEYLRENNGVVVEEALNLLRERELERFNRQTPQD